MYYYNLRVHIYASDDSLIKLLNAVKLPDDLNVRFALCPLLTRESVCSCDILIIARLPDPDTLALLNVWRTPQMLVAAILPQETLIVLPDAALEAFDRMLVTPLPQRFLSFSFANLVNMWRMQRRAWEAELRLDVISDTIPDLVMFKSADGILQKVNAAVSRAVNLPADQICGRTSGEVWGTPAEGGGPGCLESDNFTILNGKLSTFSETLETRSGPRQYHVLKTPFYDTDGTTLLGLACVARDMTDLGNLKSELDIIFNSVPFGILLCDENWTILNVNENFTATFDIAAEDILSQSYLSWKQYALRDLRPAKEADLSEFTRAREDGLHTYLLSEKEVISAVGTPIGHLCICDDVTARRRRDKEILHLATHDFLTGLYNQRFLFDYMEKHRGEQAVCAFYMDLDNFKSVNDRFGHLFGDRVLTEAADAIRAAFPGEICVRIGGDEFVAVLFGQHTREELAGRAERVLSLLASLPCRAEMGDAVELTVCVGIAGAKDSSVSTELLLHNADEAMYDVKRAGKAAYRFYEDIQ